MSGSFTLVADGATHELAGERVDDRVLLDAAAVEQSLGWVLKPEGLCRGELCVPVRDRDTVARDGRIDLAGFADALGRPLALEPAEGAAALGEAAADVASRMASLEAPDFELPDLDGRLHRLSDHRGKKVLLIAYASW